VTFGLTFLATLVHLTGSKSNSNIIALKGAIKRLDDNTNLDHADIDNNKHSIEKQNNEIRSIVAIVNKGRAELTKIDDDIAFLNTFIEILTLADAVETQIDYLIEVKVDSLKGFCNDHALSRQFLVDNLLNLEANKIGLGPVFGSWEWREYYKNRMCTVALNGDDLWVTLRIPLVKKAEKLVRTVPTPDANLLLKKAADFGLVVTLFKETVNEKYLVMTQSSLDLCNLLGNTRTCGIRDTKFSIGQVTVMPIEFALNRFLIISLAPLSLKVMSKCPNGITEHQISTDSVWLVPNNCTYSSKYLTIEARESDVAITKEIGIIHFDRFEVSQVTSGHVNNSIVVEEVLNSSKSFTFERNRIEIKEALDNVKTSHETFMSRYAVEKWIIVGLLCSLVTFLIVAKLFNRFKRTRASPPPCEEIELGLINPKQPQPNTIAQCESPSQQQQPSQLTHQSLTHDTDGNAEKRKSHIYTEITAAGNVSFSSKPEHSQFYGKK